jgi:hypothetical protein
MKPYRDRKPGRFSDLPRPGYQTVYAVQLTNGWVKVGCSYCLQNRFSLLANELRRKRGLDIADIHYGQHIDGFNHHKYAEHTLLKHIAKFAKPVPGHAEYFDSVDFQVARRLVDEVSEYALRGEPSRRSPVAPRPQAQTAVAGATAAGLVGGVAHAFIFEPLQPVMQPVRAF